MINTKLSTLLFFSTLALASCQSGVRDAQPDLLAQNLDTAVNPANDFFQYANGGWIRKNPIPPEESRWGISQLVQQDIYQSLRKISEQAASERAPSGSVAQQIGDFWTSGMDTIAIEKSGLQPLNAELNRIDTIRTIAGLLTVSADLHRKGANVLFSDGVGQDDKNSDRMAYQLAQGGLGMPDRDFYFNTDEKTVAVRKAYRQYLATTFIQLGRNSAAAQAASAEVYQLETSLATASRKLAALRDPDKNYNQMKLPDLQKLTPLISWESWLKNSGTGHVDSIIVRQPEFYTALNRQLSETPITIWKSYLQFHLVNTAAPYLDSATYRNYFTYVRSLTGTSEPRPRWKRVLDAEGNAMGEALGQLFVKEYYSPQAKRRYADLVEAIREAYKERISKLTWMSDSTKHRALDKLAHITKKVGYPDKWKNFSSLKIDRGPFVLNMFRASEWWTDYYNHKLGKPVDRTEWDMSPQTYNAYYNPSNNEIVLPAAAFFVPGRKDAELDDAFVYGYAGASTIGHEMTHGFDDQGRQYDTHGNLHNWWQPADSAQFRQRADKIIRQFNEFSPVDTLHVNGDATQGENIADLGGVLLGLDAFKKTAACRKGEKIAGLTPIQRFFLGYAYGWMEQERKEVLATQLMTDVHAPAKERANAPMSNIPAFYEAFSVKPGDKMFRPDSLRVSIW